MIVARGEENPLHPTAQAYSGWTEPHIVNSLCIFLVFIWWTVPLSEIFQVGWPKMKSYGFVPVFSHGETSSSLVIAAPGVSRHKPQYSHQKDVRASLPLGFHFISVKVTRLRVRLWTNGLSHCVVTRGVVELIVASVVSDITATVYDHNIVRLFLLPRNVCGLVIEDL